MSRAQRIRNEQAARPRFTCTTCARFDFVTSRWIDGGTARERIGHFCDGCDPHDNIRTCVACESARVTGEQELCGSCDVRVDGVAANGVW